ncbi:MAG: hypothetical protein LBR71_07445 [Synergistaceae bacterium]|jgi:hypothetical protein|nr:hypothetical protein [Synergistaceae bacterium]
METSVAERLAECLKKKKTDYMTLGSLPDALKRRLTGKAKPSAAELEKCIAPHLGEGLTLRRGGRGAYLAFGQSEESLLLQIVRKRAGKTPSVNNIPFRKEKYISVLNRLIEQGKVLVRLDKDYRPALLPAPETGGREAEGETEEQFESAYRALEGGKFFVRVCDLRRRLGWAEREFDRMAAALRDAGKIQLQAGDTAYFSKRDIADSFVDENGFRMLTLMWRG